MGGRKLPCIFAVVQMRMFVTDVIFVEKVPPFLTHVLFDGGYQFLGCYHFPFNFFIAGRFDFLFLSDRLFWTQSWILSHCDFNASCCDFTAKPNLQLLNVSTYYKRYTEKEWVSVEMLDEQGGIFVLNQMCFEDWWKWMSSNEGLSLLSTADWGC